MPTVHYEIVRHDEGWAYRVGDVYSETFASHERALKAAKDAAERQQLEGQTAAIRYEDADGNWHDEVADGQARPQTVVDDRDG